MLVNRRTAISAALLGLGSCASPFRGPFWSTIGSAIPRRTGNAVNVREASDAIPYANLVAWFERSAPAMLVLGDVDTGNVLNWYTGDRKMISTRGPFIHRTIGLEVDLYHIRYEAGWSNDLLAMDGQTHEKVVEFDHGGRTEVRFKSKFHAAKSETIEIFGKKYEVRRIDESVSSSGRHRFTNRYWIDQTTGFCWKSEQTVAPTAPALTVAILKPAILR